MYKIMFSVGEASGDVHGASVAKALLQKQPDVKLIGMGGKLMAEAGVELLYDIAELGVIGIVEVIKKLPHIKKVMDNIVGVLERERPDVLVVIDYPGFNMRLAKKAHAMGIPVIYYISPSAWAWHKSRARQVAQTTKRVAAIFPFEAEVYEQAGAKVTFVGHPLLDIVQPELDKPEAYAYFGASPEQPVLTLMPGSRLQEVVSLLPDMLEASQKIAEQVPGLQIFLPLASTIDRFIIQQQLSQCSLDVRITSDKVYDLMHISDVIIAASGTATLEAAIVGTPTVIIYKVAPLTWWLGKLLVKLPHIGLPNIVAGKKIVPELLQQDASAAQIATETIGLLTDPDKMAEVRAGLTEVRQKLGKKGAVERVAAVILEVAADVGGAT